MRAILRRRDIRLLFGGQFLSMFGDWAMFIALGVWARELTGSNAAQAYFGAIAKKNGTQIPHIPL